MWFGFKKEEELVDLSKTPWILKLATKNHPLEVSVYFPTYKEAKDHECICQEKGWTSNGVVWYN